MPRWGTKTMVKQNLSFEMKKYIPAFAMLLFLASILLTGCPDKSHQRPVPDYENMVDSGGDIEE